MLRLRILTLLVLMVAGSPMPAVAGGDAPNVINVWARATPGGTTVGAAYAEIGAKSADKLVGVASAVAEKAELHTHIDDAGVMKMRRLEGLDLPAGETHTLAPGGDHIMLFGLKEPLKTGAKVPLTLTFEKAGKVDVEAEVVAIGAAPPGAANASPGADKGSASGEHKMDHGSGSGSGSGN